MLSIVSTTNYNTNFKAASNGPDMKLLSRQITAIVVNNEIPLQKDVTERVMTKNAIKRFLLKWFPKIIEYKLRYLDKMYKIGKLRVINKKFDSEERIRELEYAHGAYKKFVYVSDLIKLPHINRDCDKYKLVQKRVHTYESNLNIKGISEERFPSGETKYYECQIVAKNGIFDDYYESIRQHLKKRVLPDGTTYTYDYYPNGHIRELICSDGTKKTYYENGKLESISLSDGSKKTYFQNGNIKEEYDKQGQLVKSNLIK